jgi:hypothetical protein
MRAITKPPPSSYCDQCGGELRLKLIEAADRGLDLDNEILASATFALKAGVWFRRGRLLMISPDSQGTACPLSGRNSTYRPVQISRTGSDLLFARRFK